MQNHDSAEPSPDQVLDGLVTNAGLVARHIERIYERQLIQDLRADRLQQALDYVIPRFNSFFRYQSDAVAAWEAFCVAIGQPGRPFPGPRKVID